MLDYTKRRVNKTWKKKHWDWVAKTVTFTDEDADGVETVEVWAMADLIKCGRRYNVTHVRPDGTLESVRTAFFVGPFSNGKSVHASLGNWYQDQHDSTEGHPSWKSWDASIAAGKSYMVGKDTPDKVYLKSHRSPLTGWQKAAYHWALANPAKTLYLENDVNDWQVNACGDYVIFALPHHGRGGERHYNSRNGRSKVLVNVD